MAIQYSGASWKFKVGFGVVVEVHIFGQDDDRHTSAPADLIHAVRIVREVTAAIDRIKARWEKIEKAEGR